MRRGITLLEILIAALLLTIGLLGALEVVTHSALTETRAADRSKAMIAARSKMEEILKEPVLQTGSDKGEGVDESTDYDWEAVIEPSANPSLFVVTVQARNRITGVTATISALRRPDIETPPEGTATTDTGATPASSTPAGAGSTL